MVLQRCISPPPSENTVWILKIHRFLRVYTVEDTGDFREIHEKLIFIVFGDTLVLFLSISESPWQQVRGNTTALRIALRLQCSITVYTLNIILYKYILHSQRPTFNSGAQHEYVLVFFFFFLKIRLQIF